VSAAGTALNDILCIEEDRTVSNDNVVRYDNKFFQIAKQQGRSTCKGLSVKVRAHLDGTYSVVRGVKLLGRYGADGQQLLVTAKTNRRRKRRKAA